MPFDGQDFTDAAILCAARNGIAVRERWTQGRASIQLPSGPAHCVMGWIEVAGASSPAEIERIVACHLYPELPWHRRVGSYVGTIGDPRVAAVIKFQDTWWRRHTTVVRLFDRALARLNLHGHDPAEWVDSEATAGPRTRAGFLRSVAFRGVDGEPPEFPDRRGSLRRLANGREPLFLQNPNQSLLHCGSWITDCNIPSVLGEFGG